MSHYFADAMISQNAIMCMTLLLGLFTKRLDVLQPNLVKSRIHEIGCYHNIIALKLCRHFDSPVTDVPVKCQSDWESLNPKLAASRLHEIMR